MTPKEQAKELVGKYNLLVPIEFGGMDKNLAIQCALTAVDEIINSSPSLPIISDVGSFVNDIEESTEFWQEVKEELLKMK